MQKIRKKRYSHYVCVFANMQSSLETALKHIVKVCWVGKCNDTYSELILFDSKALCACVHLCVSVYVHRAAYDVYEGNKNTAA